MKDKKYMNILICGSTGFIGKNLTKKLSLNPRYKLFATYFQSNPTEYPGVKNIKIDLTSREAVEKITENIDVIIQAAATTSGSKDIVEKPFLHVTDNALMNSILLRAAYKNKVKKFIFFSCSVMYKSSDQPLKEKDFDASEKIHDNYFGVGWTKVYIEKMCEFYSKLGVTKHLVIRHSNIYGPYDKYDLEKSHVFGATVNKVMNSSQSISVWGDGSEKRDLLFVDDLVSFVELVVEKELDPYTLVNIGSGSAVSIKKLVETILKVSKKTKLIIFDKSKPTIKTNIILDFSKASRLFQWNPKISLEEGIKKSLRWYKKNILEI